MNNAARLSFLCKYGATERINKLQSSQVGKTLIPFTCTSASPKISATSVTACHRPQNGSLNLQCKICNRLHPSHVNIATCRANTYLVCRILPVVWCIQNDSLSPAHTALMTPYILPQKRQIPSSGHSSSPSLHITSPSRFESWQAHWHTGTMLTNWHGNSIEYVWRICIPEVLK